MTGESAGCRFCQIARGEVPASFLHNDERFMVFLDHAPVRNGHVLVVPRLHQVYLFDMDEDNYGRLFYLVREVAVRLGQSTGAVKIGVAVKGFQVPHVHVHLVPLYGAGGLDFHSRDLQSYADAEIVAHTLRPNFADLQSKDL